MDAVSDDGRHALTLIAFIGTVFSPWYAAARRRGPTAPENHVALNAVLYGPGRKRWALTDRPRGALERDATTLRLGPSALRWEDDGLVIDIDEVTAPLPSRLRGRVRVHVDALTPTPFGLDLAGRHGWWPICPMARVEVALDRPALSWSGRAYLDSNAGSEPLEAAFDDWDWCRMPRADGGAAILYEARALSGANQCLALRIGRDGTVVQEDPPAGHALPRAPLWRMPRATRAEGPVTVARTLEDTPFYSRSLLSTRLFGEAAPAVHESLSLRRFTRGWVQMLLPFRLPRALR